MSVKPDANATFKFDWSQVTKSMKNLSKNENIQTKSLSRNIWLTAAHKSFIITKFPVYGYTSTSFSCFKALQNLEKPIVKKVKIDKNKNFEEIQAVINMANEDASEGVSVNDEYMQNDGQISTKILDATFDLISEEMKRLETDRLDYIPTVVDSKSFSKTIENMFHISFLIRDNRLGITVDRYKIPKIKIIDLSKPKEKKQKLENDKPKQGIVSMTMETWHELIETLRLENVKNIFCDLI